MCGSEMPLPMSHKIIYETDIMKTDNNGCSTCPPGCEQYEKYSYRGKTYFQYDYRAEDGELFSCVKSTLDACRKARDEYFKKKANE